MNVIMEKEKQKKEMVGKAWMEQGLLLFVTNSAVAIWFSPISMHYFD